MELPENVRIEWSSITQMTEEELIKFLEESYKFIRIGAEFATKIVTLDAIRYLVALADKENAKIKECAADIAISGWQYLDDLEKIFLCRQWEKEYEADSDTLRLLKINLMKNKIDLPEVKNYLKKCVKNPEIGLVPIDLLKYDVELDVSDFEEMSHEQADDMIFLRIVEIAASKLNDPQCQIWARNNLMLILNRVKDDILLLANVLEILQTLDSSILAGSIDILFEMRNGPLLPLMPMAFRGLIKIYTKYFAFSKNQEIPAWFIDIILGNDLDFHFQVATITFLMAKRSDTENIFKLDKRLRNLMEENYSRTDVSNNIGSLIVSILNREDCDEEMFNYWFLEKYARHFFVMSSDPDIVKREIGVTVLLAAAKFEKSIAFCQKIDDFVSFLSGPGCGDLRIEAVKRFASHSTFEVAFGPETTSMWRRANVNAIEIYDPQVEIMEL